MILRKPYAILIKNFKLIHVILTGLMAYLLYKTWNIMQFFSDYFSQGESIVGQDIASSLISFRVYLVIGIIIAGLITVLVLMYLKKKPITYYIYSIITFIFVTVIFVLTKNTIVTMEGQLVSARIARAMSDFVNIAFIAQIIASLMTFVRATGFDIKKFNFVKDLQELDIAVEDNEEFEVDVEVDTDRFKRDLKRRWRHMKYVYVENKLLINIIAAVAVVGLGVFIFFKSGMADKKYKEGQYFYTYDFMMKVNRSYITNTDYKMDTLDNYKNLVVLEITTRKLSEPTDHLELAKLELNVGDKHYYPTKAYKNQLKDLGSLYQDEKIPTQSEVTYLLAYEVPTNYLNKSMMLRYINGLKSKDNKIQAMYVNVKLNPKNLMTDLKPETVQLGSEMNTKGTILGESKLKINSYEINDQFKLDYNFCVAQNECVPSIEYVKPDILSNYDKTLLKLTGSLKMDDTIQLRGVDTVFELIQMFGTIEYEIDGKMKEQPFQIKEAKPTSATNESITYIEVTPEMKNATKIRIHFHLRNQEFIYQLK